MTNKEFSDLCIKTVRDYYNKNFSMIDGYTMSDEDVYIVWLCKTLQNHKALASTNISDGMYYELTYNGDKEELYFDAYKKTENVCIKIESPKYEEHIKEVVELEFEQGVDKAEVEAELNKYEEKGYLIEHSEVNAEKQKLIYWLRHKNYCF